jgi:AcrR family transcriptional regulator
MAQRVKTSRRYHSPRRREQAAATRRAILEAAQRLLEERGYAATSMAAIASEAGVALKTVYLVFETKAGLLRALWHKLLRGDEDSAPVGQREWYREIVDETDPGRQIELTAHNSRLVKERAAPLIEVIRTAAPTDPDIGRLWDRIQTEFYENQRGIVQAIHRNRGLARGLTVARAADILWSLNHPSFYWLLFNERGWTPKQYEEWLVETLTSQLLT